MLRSSEWIYVYIHLHTEAVVFTLLAHAAFLGQAVLTPKVLGVLKSVTLQAESFSRVKNYPGTDYLKSWDFLGIQSPSCSFTSKKCGPRVPEKVLDPSIKFLQGLKSFCCDFNLDFSS